MFYFSCNGGDFRHWIVISLTIVFIFVWSMVAGIRTHIDNYDNYKWNINSENVDGEVIYSNISNSSDGSYILSYKINYNVSGITYNFSKWWRRYRINYDTAKSELEECCSLGSIIKIYYNINNPKDSRLTLKENEYIKWVIITIVVDMAAILFIIIYILVISCKIKSKPIKRIDT